MKKIIYLHGFGSSGATQTADYLRNKLPEVEVISLDIPLHPEEARQMLNRLCYEENQMSSLELRWERCTHNNFTGIRRFW